MAKLTPLSRAADGLIERYIRSPGGPTGRASSGFRLPNLGKPKAQCRGKQSSIRNGQSPHRRRVVVILYHYKMAGHGYSKLHSHINYLKHPDEGERVRSDVFDAHSDKVEAHKIVQSWQNDRHHFRLILAPNDGADLDMQQYTRDYMAALEKELGTKLDWFSAVHEKADSAHERNRHAHVVIRGIDATGADLVLDREFIRHGMRRVAEDLATRHLGQMSDSELKRYRERMADRERAGEGNHHDGHRPKAKQAKRDRGMGHE